MKRTTARYGQIHDLFSRPFHGLSLKLVGDPSDELLGYYHSSALRTPKNQY